MGNLASFRDVSEVPKNRLASDVISQRIQVRLRSTHRDDLRVEPMEHYGNLASNSLACTGDQCAAALKVDLLSGWGELQHSKRLWLSQKFSEME